MQIRSILIMSVSTLSPLLGGLSGIHRDKALSFFYYTVVFSFLTEWVLTLLTWGHINNAFFVNTHILGQVILYTFLFYRLQGSKVSKKVCLICFGVCALIWVLVVSTKGINRLNPYILGSYMLFLMVLSGKYLVHLMVNTNSRLVHCAPFWMASGIFWFGASSLICVATLELLYVKDAPAWVSRYYSLYTAFNIIVSNILYMIAFITFKKWGRKKLDW